MREKELRLALVCYGGISLAVYMHGITRELWHLVRASRAQADGAETDGVEAAYAALLDQVTEAGGARLRVLVDIVAGASAGGINGIFLAHAIATGQKLTPLTDLWLERADVDALIDPAARMANRFAKLWAAPAIHLFASRQVNDADDPLDADTRAEVQDKLERFMRSRWFEPPFGGAVFTNMLLDAFAAMAAGGDGPRLLPPAQPLDLFVTVTDFAGHPERLQLHSPAEVVETEHRMTLSFRDDPGAPAAIGAMPALAFAARATASFPGAFPPFTVAELDAVLVARGAEWPDREAFLTRQFGDRGETVVLIDGSVLANAPFGPAISALPHRPARREVDRRFVYIDPKPGIRSVRVGSDGSAKVPGFLATILGALSDIPREQPIRDNLDAIAGRSARIARLRTIVDRIRPAVDAAVAGLFKRTFFLDRATPSRIALWRERAAVRAAQDAGLAHEAYLALRAITTVQSLPAADRASAAIEADADAAAFLHARDAAFRARRITFVARHLAALADAGEEALYAAARDAIYDARAAYFAGSAPADLSARDAADDAAMADALAAIPRTDRRGVLFAYLGFPFYDATTFPLLQGEGLDEFDAIKVDRVSPDDATTLRGGGARATLKGVRFNSFGAFFSRAYRENDYLWGRLHGAERMVDIVGSTLASGTAPPDLAAAKRALFAAILTEERGRLRRIGPLIDALTADNRGSAHATPFVDCPPE